MITTVKRDRKRRTRVGALTCALRITSSSAMVCEICSATTAMAISPIDSITPSAAALSNDLKSACSPTRAAMTSRTSAAPASISATSACANEKRRRNCLTIGVSLWERPAVPFEVAVALGKRRSR